MGELSDKLRKRLAEMNRRQEAAPERAAETSPFQEGLKRANRAFDEPHAGTPAHLSMEEALAGRDVQTPCGPFYLIEPPPETLHPFIRTIVQSHLRLHPDAPDALEPPLPDYRPIRGVPPGRLLYLDIETTGLTGVPLFLVGLMYLDGDRIRMSQLLARDYSEEAALLAYLAEQFPHYECVITFNGRTFDLPYIRDRYFANALRCRFPARHLDLLGLARRRWRDRLPDCRLQTLERWVCGRDRDGDIPGAEIPDMYHKFVRTGNAALLRPILEHNALDLITMGDLLGRLLEKEDT
jgi:uncharacterized protein YprB with RNaseH-like and TPR domain